MPITATFTADFTKWNEGLRNATASLKPLEVSAKGVQSQLEKMARSLSGEQIIKQAQLATAAVKSIGGATKLTEAEQKKLNATVTEAIAKYAALGHKAPADMIALAKATKASESAFSGIGTALGPLKGLLAATFAVGAITRVAGEALQFASDLNDLSSKTGISTKALQEFKFAGEQVGVTLDDVSTAILQMQKHLVGGDKSTVAALKGLGLSLKDLKGLRPEDQFNKIADELRKIEDPAVRNKTAFDLMGKAAASVLPLIASDLKGARAEAERLGIVLDQETINQLDNLGDTWAKIKLAGEALIAKVLVPMVPAIQGVLEIILPLTAAFGSFAKAPYIAAKAIFELQRKLAELRGDSEGQLAAGLGKFFVDQELKKLDASLKVVIPTLGDFGDGAAEAGKKVNTLRDEISGAALLKDLRDLKQAWDSLTPTQKTNAIAIGEVVDRYQKLAERLPSLPPDLKAFATAMNKAAEETGRMTLKVGELKPLMDTLGSTTDKTGKAFRDWGFDVGFEATIPVINLGKALKETDGFISTLPESIDKAKKETKDWKQSIDDLANAFATLGQIAGGTLGSVLQGIGKIVGVANLAVKSVEGISAGMKAVSAAKGIKDMIGGFAQLASGILGAAAAAVELGKALYDALTKSRPEQLQGSVLKDFGVSIGEDLGKTIADSAIKEFRGSFQAAQIGNLDKIIQAGGGITISNLGKLEDRLHDVFSLLQTGELTGAQAQDILNKNFQTFADFLGGDVNPELKEIIRLNKEFGTQSKAILDFVAKNASLAASGFNKIAENLDAIPGTINRIGPVAEATFGALLDGGKSVVEALQEMGPGFEAVQKALKASGQEATGFLAQVLGWQNIVENNKGVFDALSGTLDVLKGLNNAGALTEEAFAQLGATIDDAFNKLTSQGVSAADAIKLMQPQLQELWELEKDFGYSVDAATQELIDQAVAAGEVGEKHRSIQEQMLDLQKQELAVLEAIGKAFGVTIPNDISKTGAAFDKLGNKIDNAVAQIPDSIHIPVRFDIPEGPDNNPTGGRPIPFEAGGPVYAAGGYFRPRGTDTVPAMLSPGEFVVSRRGVQSAGMPALRSINRGQAPSGGGSVTTVNVYVQNHLDHQESKRLAEAIAPHIPGVVANGGATHSKFKRMTKALAS